MERIYRIYTPRFFACIKEYSASSCRRGVQTAEIIFKYALNPGKNEGLIFRAQEIVKIIAAEREKNKGDSCGKSNAVHAEKVPENKEQRKVKNSLIKQCSKCGIGSFSG